MTSLFQLNKIAYLPIDYQTDYLRFLPDAVAQSFVQRSLAFSIKLKAFGIPTIWIGASTGWHETFFVPRRTEETASMIEALGLASPLDQQRGSYYNKIKANVFSTASHFRSLNKRPYFFEILRSRGIEIVILSGLFTKGCIKRSIQGGLNHGFSCVVAYDLLADDVALDIENETPLWHKNQLFKAFAHSPKRPLLKTSARILATLDRKTRLAAG